MQKHGGRKKTGAVKEREASSCGWNGESREGWSGDIGETRPDHTEPSGVMVRAGFILSLVSSYQREKESDLHSRMMF